jgi:hypothetical protein
MTSEKLIQAGLVLFVVARVWFTSMFKILINQLDTIAGLSFKEPMQSSAGSKITKIEAPTLPC